MADPEAIVREWHDAVNASDADRVARLVAEEVEVGGPRGTGHGRALVLDWVGHAGIHLEPTSFHASGDTVIVGQLASWRDDTGQPTEPEPVATVFIVRDRQIVSIIRYPDLDAALAASRIA